MKNRVKEILSEKAIGLILLCLLCFISSCNNVNKENTIEQRNPENEVTSIPLHFPSSNVAYKRDSLFAAATVRQFIYKKVSPFGFYDNFHIPLDKIRIDVDSIIYSPDSLKLFAFVIETTPDKQGSNLNMVNYSGNSLIGYRLNVKSYWTIYNFDQFSTGGFRKYNSIRKLFREYYFGNGKFKSDAEYIWDSTRNERISVKFGYNLDEPGFWDKSLVWRKGARIPGYYNFQTVGNVKPNEENGVINLPILNYPDSLLELYN